MTPCPNYSVIAFVGFPKPYQHPLSFFIKALQSSHFKGHFFSARTLAITSEKGRILTFKVSEQCDPKIS